MHAVDDFLRCLLLAAFGCAGLGCYQSHELPIPPVSDPWRPDVAERFDLDLCVPTSAPISLGDAGRFAALVGGAAITPVATDAGIVVATTPNPTSESDDTDIDVVVWFASNDGTVVQSARLEGCGKVLDVAWNRARDRVLVVASKCWSMLDPTGRALGDPMRDWWPFEMHGGTLRSASVANRDGDFVVVASVLRDEWLSKIARMPARPYAPVRWATELRSSPSQSGLWIAHHESGALTYIGEQIRDPADPLAIRELRYFRLEEDLSLTPVATVVPEGMGWQVHAGADPDFRVDFLDSATPRLFTSWTDVRLERVRGESATTTTLIETAPTPIAGVDHRPIGNDRILLAADRLMGTDGVSVASYRFSEARFEGPSLLLDTGRGIPWLMRTQCGFAVVWLRTEEDRNVLEESIQVALGRGRRPWSGQVFAQRFECCGS